MGTNVLLVEDNGVLALDLQDRARVLGISLTATRDPDDAVRMVDEIRPAAALIDVNLRGGYEGLDLARAIRNRTKVVIVTAYSVADLAGRMDGVSDLPIYHKPVEAAFLSDVLRDVLGLQTVG